MEFKGCELWKLLDELRDEDGRDPTTWNGGKFRIRRDFSNTNREAHDWLRQELKDRGLMENSDLLTAGNINSAANKWTTKHSDLVLTDEEKETQKQNKIETGSKKGKEGVQAFLDKTSICMSMSKELDEYRKSRHWIQRSAEYRKLAKWTCELCGSYNPQVVAHHMNYERLWKELDSDLLAVCNEPCHQLADIARYFQVGRITLEQIAAITEPLFEGIR